MHCVQCRKEILDKGICPYCGVKQHKSDPFFSLGDLCTVAPGGNPNGNKTSDATYAPLSSDKDYFHELGDIINSGDNASGGHSENNSDTGYFKQTDTPVGEPAKPFVWERWKTIAACLCAVIALSVLAIVGGRVPFHSSEQNTGNVLIATVETPVIEVENVTETENAEHTEYTEMTFADSLVLAYSEEGYEVPAKYYYNKDGLCVRKVQEAWGKITEYEYYTDGTIKKETLYQDDEPYMITEYDSSGNPSAEYYAESDGKNIVLNLACAYTNVYDAQGRMIECTVLSEESTDGQFITWGERCSYTYYENGSYDVEYSDFYYYEGELFPHCHNVKSYSSNGALAKAVYDLENMSECSSTTVYTYDEYGNPVTKEWDYEFEGSYETQEYVYENTYDGANRLIQTEVYRAAYSNSSDGIEEEPMTLWNVITYNYDADGRLIKEITQTPSLEYTTENIWEYDSAGNLTRFYGIPEDDYSEVENIYQYKPLSEVLYVG